MDPEKVKQEKILKDFVEKEEKVQEPQKSEEKATNQIGPEIIQIPGTPLPWQREESPIANQIGWISLPIKDLPTQGLFYPIDTNIAIRSARGEEVRHWSTLEETDFSALDDMLNYIIERCVTIKSTSEEGLRLSWKDIKEVDRFYLLLAIHELTFPEGENKLQVKLSDTKKVDVKKEMVSYITLDPTLMKYYDEVERCFVLKPKGGALLKIEIPSIGVTQWLKHYIQRKRETQQNFDEDYLTYAPFVIRNWRGLTDDTYNEYVVKFHKWDITTVSLLVHVRKIFSDTIDPIIKFIDDGGMERTAPLNFQGGIKSLFIISDPFGQLE